MILLVCVILFVVFSIVEASGKDWELGQILSEYRTNRIVSAIGRASDEIKSSYEYVSREQINYFERVHKDMEKEDADHAVAIDAPEAVGLSLGQVDKAQDECEE